MIPVEKLYIVSPQQSLNEVLRLLVTQNVNQVPVVVDGRLVGVLSREDIVRTLDIRRSLGVETGDKGEEKGDRHVWLHHPG